MKIVQIGSREYSLPDRCIPLSETMEARKERIRSASDLIRANTSYPRILNRIALSLIKRSFYGENNLGGITINSNSDNADGTSLEAYTHDVNALLKNFHAGILIHDGSKRESFYLPGYAYGVLPKNERAKLSIASMVPR